MIFQDHWELLQKIPRSHETRYKTNINLTSLHKSLTQNRRLICLSTIHIQGYRKILLDYFLLLLVVYKLIKLLCLLYFLF